MLQPWFVEKRPSRVKGEATLHFAFHVESLPESPVHLLLERPELFQTTINGKDLSSKATEGWMIDPCLVRLRIPAGALKRGENVVELRAGILESTNLEALYLTGKFGVRIEGTNRTLVALPDTLCVGTVATQGLPFYSGRIRYVLELPRLPAAGERFFLTVDDFEGACVAVRSSGDERVIMPWTPYEADITDLLRGGSRVYLEVVLTRRNTFGPLHQVPLRAPAYGPHSFITEGGSFTNNYMLYPAGLLESPAVRVRHARH
jgi:hypothetical protein